MSFIHCSPSFAYYKCIRLAFRASPCVYACVVNQALGGCIYEESRYLLLNESLSCMTFSEGAVMICSSRCFICFCSRVVC